MNLVGKIFVVVQFVMSVTFMALAVCVYGTHTNWMDEIERPKTANDPGGYAARLTTAISKNRILNSDLAKSRRKLDSVQASHTRTHKQLAAALKLTEEAKDKVATRMLVEITQKNDYALALLEAQKELGRIAGELAQLHKGIVGTKTDRNQQFQRVVVLTDLVHQLLAQQDILAERNGTLLVDISKYKDFFKREGITIDGALAGTVVVDGVVQAVGREDLLEISIGSDDGLKKGHTLHVFRNSKYLAKIEIVEITPDRAVAKVIRGTLRGPIRRGDIVATKI